MGCSIEISRDIYMYVGLSTIVYGKPIQKFVCYNAWVELRSPNACMLKVNFGSLKQSAEYNFRLEFLIQLKQS